MLLNQTFSLSDIPLICLLACLEIVLSIDNAVVLSVLTSKLSESLRKKALWVGSISAFGIRAVMLLILSFLIQYQWIQALAAIYLLYLSFCYFFKKKKKKESSYPKLEFWKAIVLVEMFDIIFAFDSIFAAIALVSSKNPTEISNKIWVVYFGGMIGLLAIRYGAHLLTKVIHRFPHIEKSAYLMIGWVALKLIFEQLTNLKELDTIFWIGLLTLIFYGLFNRQQKHG